MNDHENAHVHETACAQRFSRFASAQLGLIVLDHVELRTGVTTYQDGYRDAGCFGFDGLWGLVSIRVRGDVRLPGAS